MLSKYTINTKIKKELQLSERFTNSKTLINLEKIKN